MKSLAAAGVATKSFTPPLRRIVTVVAEQRVVAAVADDVVVTITAMNDVVDVGTEQAVVARTRRDVLEVVDGIRTDR